MEWVEPDVRNGAQSELPVTKDPGSGQGQIVFVAMRDIAADEELTHDWATTDDLEYEMSCKCASSTCRGTVTGRDWMRPELQEKYKGWFCWFIQRKIDRLQQRNA